MPVELANRLNVVAIGVNYLQSGKADPQSVVPYDFGYLQALDALRALWFVHDGLTQRKTPFATGRIYAVGGSGGGNVSLMCNKFAPRTFACIVDMSGMAKLSDAIAFGPPDAPQVTANYDKAPTSPRYLSPDAQEIRFVGQPEHLRLMKQWGNASKVVVIPRRDRPDVPRGRRPGDGGQHASRRRGRRAAFHHEGRHRRHGGERHGPFGRQSDGDGISVRRPLSCGRKPPSGSFAAGQAISSVATNRFAIPRPAASS